MLSRRYTNPKICPSLKSLCLLLLFSCVLLCLTARPAFASAPSGELQQQLRQRCEDAWHGYAEEIALEDLQLPLAEQDLLHDLLSGCPQYNWYVGSHVVYYNTETEIITKAVPNYLYSQKQTRTMQEQLARVLAELLSDIPSDMAPALKALLLHDRLIERCTYDHAAADTPEYFPDAYTAYGALVRGRAVCEGYAMAYMLLLDKAGIPSVRIVSEEARHAWTAVEIGGNLYHVDPTFDDPTGEVSLGLVSHDYFLLSDAELLADGKHGTDFDRVSPNSLPESSLFAHSLANAATCFRADHLYYIDEEGTLLCHNPADGSETVLRQANKGECIVSVSSSKYVSYEWDPAHFAFLACDDGGIYYNDTRHVWRLSPESHEAEIVYTEPDDHMIVGLTFQDGLLQVEIFDATASYYSEETCRRIIATDIEQKLAAYEADIPASVTGVDETQPAEETAPEAGSGEEAPGNGSRLSLKELFLHTQIPLPAVAVCLIILLLLRRPGKRRRR